MSQSLASKQGVEAPIATAPRGHVQVEKTEQDGGNALVLNRRHAIRCVELPVRNRHHARKDKCDGPRSEAKHDRDPAKELRSPPIPVWDIRDGVPGCPGLPPNQPNRISPPN